MRRKICFCPCEESSGGLKKNGLQGLFGVSPAIRVCMQVCESFIDGQASAICRAS